MSGQGAAIGAATGATYALATGKDPIKYAMIGGAVGGTGGAALGAGGTLGGTGTTIAGSGGALTGAGASTAANTAFVNPAGVNASANALMGASQTAPTLATTTPGIFATPSAYVPTQNVAVERSYGTLESLLNPNIQSSSMAPTFMQQVGSGAGQLGQFAQQNPVLTQMAMQSAQQMMQQPQRRASPPGLLRGTQMQVSAPQYQVGVPQVSLI